jgi:GNAT superfamily N-acetyltransferase
MSYDKPLRSGIVVVSTRAEHAAQLERLQEICFPSLDPAERFKKEQYLKHIEIFPDGQFVALNGERVVGMTSTLRMEFDFEHTDRTFAEVAQGGWLTSHDPKGSWLYGADIGTHLDYRRRGIARGLYAARHDTVRRLGLRGQVTVGMLRGYGALKEQMSADEYYESMIKGERADPTVSAQMKVGFQPRGLIRDYLNDPACEGCGVLLVFEADRDVESA